MSDTGDEFVIELSGGPVQYDISVSSPAGEYSTPVRIDSANIRARIPEIQTTILASAVRARTSASDLEEPVRAVGRELYDAIFQNAVLGLFVASRQRLAAREERLRVVLRIRSPDVAVLPWELMYNEAVGGYLCLRDSIVRYVDMPEALTPPTVAAPLHVLGMVAVPGTCADLAVEVEKGRLQKALGPLVDAGRVQLDWVGGETAGALQAALMRGCHIFHFIGHGGFDRHLREGFIVLSNEHGDPAPLRASALAAMLHLGKPWPRLVVLNSCETGVGSAEDLFSSAATVSSQMTPAVVAMQFAISDKAATSFASAFYAAIAQNVGVDSAVSAARIALCAESYESLEWSTPVLYLRGRDTRVFQISPKGDSKDCQMDSLPEPIPRRPEPVIVSNAPVTPEKARSGESVAMVSHLDQDQWVYAVASSPDGRYLAIGTRRWVRLVHLATGATMWRRAAGAWASAVVALRFSPDGFLLATGCFDNTARVLQVNTGAELARLRHRETVFGVAFLPDSRRLATGSADRTVRVWEVNSGAEVQRLKQSHPVRSVAVDRTNGHILTGSLDGCARMWDIAGKELLVIRHDHRVLGVAFTPDARRVVTGSGDGSACVWDATSGEPLARMLHGQPVRDVAVSPDGRWVATGCNDGTVRLWDLDTGTEIARYAHERAVVSIAFGPASDWLASATEGKTVRITSLR